jgi:hypothetical protein
MRPEVPGPTMYRIEVWSRVAMVVLALIVAPHVSAQAIREPDDKGDDLSDEGRAIKPTSGVEARPTGTTVLSISLTGTGVKAQANSSPTPHPTNGPVKNAAATGGNQEVGGRDSGAALGQRSDVKEGGERSHE